MGLWKAWLWSRRIENTMVEAFKTTVTLWIRKFGQTDPPMVRPPFSKCIIWMVSHLKEACCLFLFRGSYWLNSPFTQFYLSLTCSCGLERTCTMWRGGRSWEPCEISQFLFALPVSSLPVSLKLVVKLNTGEGSELWVWFDIMPCISSAALIVYSVVAPAVVSMQLVLHHWYSKIKLTYP